jgi:hypothetical protein
LTADFLASHALLLVGAALLLISAAGAVVLAAALLAVRYRERLWAWIDLIVPELLADIREESIDSALLRTYLVDQIFCSSNPLSAGSVR